tara:strand:- start:2270 stop:2578 length:309 start_codon:yes stop_codon:yes gene_type:complete
MSKSNRAYSAEIQAIKVLKFMDEFGSINRYEADYIGVCHLAARIKELKERGLECLLVDENNVKDFHETEHNGIRRYFINWQNMSENAIQLFTRLISNNSTND